MSSRTNRRKDDTKLNQQRPEDFMDEEDLADAEESRKLQTNQAFAALGSTEDDVARSAGLAGLFRVEGETMGTKLLKKMGWKEGQGIGPKVMRKARLEAGSRSEEGASQEYHLFAPDKVALIQFVKKLDHKGLGYAGQNRLAPLRSTKDKEEGQSDEDEEVDFMSRRQPVSLMPKKKEKKRGGIGIGIINDTGSDDEDPYEIGPRISYNRVIGGEKKKKKNDASSTTTAANPLLKSKPVFKSRKLGKLGLRAKKCHDGRLPLDGFVLSQHPDPLTSEINDASKYPPPKVPPEWKSTPQSTKSSVNTSFVSTADAAKAFKLDPKSRADILGEALLPGKSVFDFMSTSARERLVSATGKKDLPEARGEIPAAYAMSAEDKLAELLKDVPTLDKATAVAALARGASGGAPYADNEDKRKRYRAYLEYQAGSRQSLPPKPAGVKDDDWLREFYEFFNCARIFKPMTGFMASRFTTSKSSSTVPATNKLNGDGNALITRPAPKPTDPAEEAAKLGMFGPMTRSVKDFYPNRLLCKRFNVKPPVVVEPDAELGFGSAPLSVKQDYSQFAGLYRDVEAGSQDDVKSIDATAAITGVAAENKPPIKAAVDPDTNAALEQARAGEEVFKAIFGDTSDDDD